MLFCDHFSSLTEDEEQLKCIFFMYLCCVNIKVLREHYFRYRSKTFLKYLNSGTCKTRLGSPVFCDSCFKSLASGLWLMAKYDFMVLSW